MNDDTGVQQDQQVLDANQGMDVNQNQDPTQQTNNGGVQDSQIQQSQSINQTGWDTPLEWEGQDGKAVQAKLGDLIETYMGMQQTQPYVQVGRLFEAAARGDARASQALLSLLGQQNGQSPAQPRPGAAPGAAAQVPPELAQRMDTYEQMMYERTLSEIKSGLQAYIQQSSFNALKAEPRVVDSVTEELMKMVQAGVMPRQEDVEALMTQWNAYYEELAGKITGRSVNQPDIPSLDGAAGSPSSGRTPSIRWGRDSENPDPKFRTYLQDKIRNLMASDMP